MCIIVRKAKKEELPEILELLQRAELPHAGVQEHLSNFLVAVGENDESGLVGTAGLEIYDRVGLLRSVAVKPETRSKGLGARLVEAVLSSAREKDLEVVYLLTTTADKYFPKFGFQEISRVELDPRLGPSEELRGACPQSAICMKLRL